MKKQRGLYMNLPNKLTLFRVVLIPVMVVLSYFLKDIVVIHTVSLSNLLVLIVFVIAAFTDFLDGYIARKYNMVTNFGKFMDPLADKLLVLAGLIILLEMNVIYGWAVILILAREFMVTGIRLLAVEDSVVIAASKLGKAKTVSQMLMIIFLLLGNYPFVLINIPMDIIFIYIATALTVVSGIDYFIKNKHVIFKSK